MPSDTPYFVFESPFFNIHDNFVDLTQDDSEEELYFLQIYDFQFGLSGIIH